MGKKLLAAGQLADALSHFHAAIGMHLGKVTCIGIPLGFVLLFVLLSIFLANSIVWVVEVGAPLCSSFKLGWESTEMQ